MQNSSGGFWQPDGAADEVQGGDSAAGAAPISSSGFSSTYDGYDLTEPQIPNDTKTVPSVSEVSWEASEYIQHDKDISWFIILSAIAFVLFGVALFFKQWTFAALVIAMTAAIIVYARRPPRTLHYKLGLHNFSIEGKPYSYSDFRAFGLSQEGPLHMVTLLPLKRFSPPVSMYFEEQDGEQIVDILAVHMPMEKLKPDFFDDLVRKLRF